MAKSHTFNLYIQSYDFRKTQSVKSNIYYFPTSSFVILTLLLEEVYSNRGSKILPADEIYTTSTENPIGLYDRKKKLNAFQPDSITQATINWKTANSRSVEINPEKGSYKNKALIPGILNHPHSWQNKSPVNDIQPFMDCPVKI